MREYSGVVWPSQLRKGSLCEVITMSRGSSLKGMSQILSRVSQIDRSCPKWQVNLEELTSLITFVTFRHFLMVPNSGRQYIPLNCPQVI